MTRGGNRVIRGCAQRYQGDPPFTIRVAPQCRTLKSDLLFPDVGARLVFDPNYLAQNVIQVGFGRDLGASAEMNTAQEFGQAGSSMEVSRRTEDDDLRIEAVRNRSFVSTIESFLTTEDSLT